MSRQPWSRFYFSFDGRISRRQYWLRWALPFLIPASFLFYVLDRMNGDHRRIPVGQPCLLLGLTLFVVLLFSWASLAVSVKRFHDINKSGWWVLIGVIPIIGAIWVLYENSYLQGTVGPNRFGPEPHET